MVKQAIISGGTLILTFAFFFLEGLLILFEFEGVGEADEKAPYSGVA